MKLPDGGDFEGMDPVSAKAALLFSKDREVQMVWCQLFRCLTKLRMTKRDLYDRVDADHGDSITYDELIDGLKGLEMIDAEISSADLHALVCSVFPSRSIVHEWGVFEKLMSTYQAEMAPHSFAEWAAMNLLAARKEVAKFKGQNQKLHDQGLVLNQTNENIKRDLVEFPRIRDLADTQKTLASTEQTLAETQRRRPGAGQGGAGGVPGVHQGHAGVDDGQAGGDGAPAAAAANGAGQGGQEVQRPDAHVADMEARMKKNDAQMRANAKKMAAMEKENRDREGVQAESSRRCGDQGRATVAAEAKSTLEKRVHGLESPTSRSCTSSTASAFHRLGARVGDAHQRARVRSRGDAGEDRGPQRRENDAGGQIQVQGGEGRGGRETGEAGVPRADCAVGADRQGDGSGAQVSGAGEEGVEEHGGGAEGGESGAGERARGSAVGRRGAPGKGRPDRAPELIDEPGHGRRGRVVP